MLRPSTRALAVSAALVVALVACGEEEPPEGAPEPPATEGPNGESPADDDPTGPPGEWVPLTDEPSGTRFALPENAAPAEDVTSAPDGTEVALRNYAATAEGGIEVGFNIIDLPGDEYSVEAGVEGIASSVGGEVRSTNEVEVDGNDAVEVEMVYGDEMVVLFQLITTDEHVMQTVAAGPEAEVDAVQDVYEQLNDSLEIE